MARRTIFDHTPDPVELFDELYYEGERDFIGLPLRDVAGHVGRCYTACYGALCLARMLTDIGRIDLATTIDIVGAHFQDKRTSTEFPAAHSGAGAANERGQSLNAPRSQEFEWSRRGSATACVM